MDKLLSIDDMCERFPGTTRGSWAQLRYAGRGGPRWRKVGKRVYYAEADVIAFLDESARTTTAA
jgi:hypothetical protein